MRRAMFGLMLAIALVPAAIAIGTVAFGEGEFHAVIVNKGTGQAHPYTAKSWPTKQACEDALGNWSLVLASIADPNPDVKVIEPAGADPDLTNSLELVLLSILQNSGHLPNFTIHCE